MELADRAIGFLLTITSLTICTYYTFWMIIPPFADSDHFIHQHSLSLEYAILIPVFAGVALLCFLSIFIGHVMLKSKKKKARPAGIVLHLGLMFGVFHTPKGVFQENTLQPA